MESLFYSLLTLALQWFRPRYNVHLQMLQAQIRMLRSRIDVSRIVPTPQEKPNFSGLVRKQATMSAT